MTNRDAPDYEFVLHQSHVGNAVLPIITLMMTDRLVDKKTLPTWRSDTFYQTCCGRLKNIGRSQMNSRKGTYQQRHSD